MTSELSDPRDVTKVGGTPQTRQNPPTSIGGRLSFLEVLPFIYPTKPLNKPNRRPRSGPKGLGLANFQVDFYH